MAIWADIGAQIDIKGIYVGTDVTIIDTIYQSGTTTPQDITGWQLQFVVHTYSSTVALITKTTGSGITITDGPAGKLSVAIDAADTASLAPSTYIYHVERTDTGSDEVLSIGTFFLLMK